MWFYLQVTYDLMDKILLLCYYVGKHLTKFDHAVSVQYQYQSLIEKDKVISYLFSKRVIWKKRYTNVFFSFQFDTQIYFFMGVKRSTN